jgi:hypothetical protein
MGRKSLTCVPTTHFFGTKVAISPQEFGMFPNSVFCRIRHAMAHFWHTRTPTVRENDQDRKAVFDFSDFQSPKTGVQISKI